MAELDWIKEVDWKGTLTGDLKEIADKLGIDVLMQLWEHFGKTSIYLTEKPLDQLKKLYILKNKQCNAKELARKLGVSEMFVYQTLQQSSLKEDQVDLFK